MHSESPNSHFTKKEISYPPPIIKPTYYQRFAEKKIINDLLIKNPKYISNYVNKGDLMIGSEFIEQYSKTIYN